ncbi:MAG: alpha/beta hydrolase [Henriciella sp.]|nr:alpha/beta hydrolase [Henriciella sp.]
MKTFLACVLALGLVCGCGGPPTPDGPEASVEGEIAAPVPTRFTVQTVGAGPDIILVPGLASHPDVFAQTVDHLRDRYTLHLVHIAGFAGAPAAGNDGESEILRPVAQEVATYAASLDQRPAIVGHSLGGLISLAAALEAPNAFDRIMVVDVLPFFSVMIDPVATEDTVIPMATVLKTTLLTQSEEVYEARQREALAALTKSEEALQKSLDWSLETDRGVMAQAMFDVLTTDLRDEVAGIETPMTVLYARDPQIPNMEQVEQQYIEAYGDGSGMVLRPIDGALHFIMYDQRDQFLTEIDAFLE